MRGLDSQDFCHGSLTEDLSWNTGNWLRNATAQFVNGAGGVGSSIDASFAPDEIDECEVTFWLNDETWGLIWDKNEKELVCLPDIRAKL